MVFHKLCIVFYWTNTVDLMLQILQLDRWLEMKEIDVSFWILIYCWIHDSFKYMPQFTFNSFSSVFNTFYLKWKKYAQHLLRRIPVNLFCARVAALKSLLIQGKFVWMPYLIADMMMSTVYTIELLRLWPHLMNLFSCMFII